MTPVSRFEAACILGLLVGLARSGNTTSFVQEARLRVVIVDSIDVPGGLAMNAQPALERISAFVVTPGGTVFIADNRLGELRAFDRAGQVLAEGSLQAQSGSPRIAASALAYGGTDTLYLYDQRSRMVHVYAKQMRRLTRLRAFGAGVVTGVGMCAVRNHIYLLGYREGAAGIVHQYTLSGQHVRSFGTPVGSNAAAREAILAAGSQIVCIDQGLIVVTQRLAPSVRAFGLSGEERWTYQSPDFRAIEVRSAEGGAVQFRRRPGSDATAGSFGASADHLVVQVVRGSRQVASGRQSIESTVLRLSDGSAVSTQANLPLILAGNSSSLVTLAPDAPLRLRAYGFRVTTASQ